MKHDSSPKPSYSESRRHGRRHRGRETPNKRFKQRDQCHTLALGMQAPGDLKRNLTSEAETT
jgi:hypothetical protein